MKQQVFISWGGPLGQRVAQQLRATLLEHPAIEPFFSTRDLHHGETWLGQLRDKLNHAHCGIVCLTPGASTSAWLNWEVGILHNRYYKKELASLHVLGFSDSKIPDPLASIQRTNPQSLDEMLGLLASITGYASHELSEHASQRFSTWERFLKGITAAPLYKLHARAAELFDLNSHPLLMQESLAEDADLARVCIAPVELWTQNIRGMSRHFETSASQYPEVLIHLQREHKVKVRALAVIGADELFWRRGLGRAMVEHVCADSERVFAFQDADQLSDYLPMLRGDASRYRVYVISRRRLEKVTGVHEDFSLIGPSDSIVATYEGEPHSRRIRFDGDRERAGRCADRFDRIRDAAMEIREGQWLPLGELVAKVFGRDRSVYSKEMSRYIPLREYHENEERHVGYREMVEAMRRWISERGEALDVLEVGAGTGLFTKQLESASCTRRVIAIEIDDDCIAMLRSAFEESSKVDCVRGDAVRYDGSRRFDIVCSAFAEHHIRSEDRRDYLGRVRRHLKPDGLFVCGDEFLRPYANKAERRAALDAWHGYVIDQARALGGDGDGLIKIETLAWHSGLVALGFRPNETNLAEGGDYKVSIAEYEQALRDAEFRFERLRLSSEREYRERGSICVYRAWPV